MMSFRSLRANVGWAVAGIGMFALCQWAIIVAIAKIGSPRMAGEWTLALAITAPIFILCQLKLRTVQATDTQGENTWSEFVALRIGGVVLASLGVGVVVVINYRDETGQVLLAMTVSRVFDAGSDLVYGAMQKRENMRAIASSQIGRGLTTAIVGILLLEASGSVFLVALGTAIATGVWFLRDVRQVRRLLGPAPIGPSWTWPPLRRLLWRVAPLGLVTAIGSLQVNIPRYFLEAYDSRADVGIFGALAALLAFGVIAINALTTSVVPRLARAAATEDWTGFVRVLRKLMVIGFAMGLCGIVGAKLFGARILAVLYTPAYAEHAGVLVILAVVGTLTWTYVFLGTALDALRHYTIQPWIHGTSSVVIAIAAALLVPDHGMGGAAMAMLVGYTLEALLYFVAVGHRIRRGSAASARRLQKDRAISVATHDTLGVDPLPAGRGSRSAGRTAPPLPWRPINVPKGVRYWLRRIVIGIGAVAIPPRRVNVTDYLAARETGSGATEDAFFWVVRLWSGVFKATKRDRFNDTFPGLGRHLPTATADGSFRVLDVACSSGISTVEFHRWLIGRGLRVQTIGTDLVIRIMHVSFEKGVAALVDSEGHILAVELDGMIVDRQPSRAMRLYHPWRVRRARAFLQQWPTLPHDVDGKPLVGTVTELPLVTAEIKAEPDVNIVEEDLLSPTVVGTFDLVRAANILNLGYFSAELLDRMIVALLPRLARGGLLFITRTDSSQRNHGTVWRATERGLVRLEDIGDGSEIAELVERVADREQPDRGGKPRLPTTA